VVATSGRGDGRIHTVNRTLRRPERLGRYGLGERLRADYATPVPAHQRDRSLGTFENGDGIPTTPYYAYLEELLAHFGGDEVEHWGHVEVFHGYERIRVRVHGIKGVDFLGIRLEGGRFELRRGATIRHRKVIESGEPIGTVACEEELKLLALEHAPPRPPPEWTFESWHARKRLGTCISKRLHASG